MSYRADKHVITAHTDGRTDTQTDAGNDNTWRPKLASGKKVFRSLIIWEEKVLSKTSARYKENDEATNWVLRIEWGHPRTQNIRERRTSMEYDSTKYFL